MPKFAVAVIVALIISVAQTGWCQLSPSQEKRLKELEAKEKVLNAWEINKAEQEEKLDKLETKGVVKKDFPYVKEMTKPPVSKGREGRFQAIRMDSNAVFILDTMEGHLWVWVIQKDGSGQPAEFLFYQGQVVPGSNMGDLIDRTYKKRTGN